MPLEEYYREYLEMDGPQGPYTAEIRMCHDFPEILPTGCNMVAVLDPAAVAVMTDILILTGQWVPQPEWPTDTWALPDGAAFIA